MGVLSSIGYGFVRDARKSAMRVRCRAALKQVHHMEVLHAASHGGYTDRFEALHDLGLSDPLDPVYSFELTVNPARDAYRCRAWGNLDGDAPLDSLAIDQRGAVAVLAED
jgi:hypothetical protein